VSHTLTRVTRLITCCSWKFVLNLWNIAQIVTIIPGLVSLAVQEYYWYGSHFDTRITMTRVILMPRQVLSATARLAVQHLAQVLERLWLEIVAK
jgi:hypothetical protein